MSVDAHHDLEPQIVRIGENRREGRPMRAPDMFALGGRPAGEAQILSLFREWVALSNRFDAIKAGNRNHPDIDSLLEPTLRQRDEVEEAILGYRDGGAAGLAVKAFLCALQECGSSLGGAEIAGEVAPWWAAMLRDAAVYVPEIAELAAAAIHEDAALIEADKTATWTRGELDEFERPMPPAASVLDFVYHRVKRRLDLDEELNDALTTIANIKARTERGKEIKERYAREAAALLV